jgi:hypothetical protein
MPPIPVIRPGGSAAVTGIADDKNIVIARAGKAIDVRTPRYS